MAGVTLEKEQVVLSDRHDNVDFPGPDPVFAIASSPVDEVELPTVGSPQERLIDQWVAIACYHARVRQVDDLYVADVAGIEGAWADGETPAQALTTLGEVLTDWVNLKLDHGDKNIPSMEGVKLVIDE